MPSDSISPLSKAPKPKPRKIKSKKIKKTRKKKGLIPKKIVGLNSLLADFSGKNMRAVVQDLSGPELKKLDKMIQKLQKRTLKKEKSQKANIRTSQKLAEEISKRKSRALKEELKVKEKVLNQLKKLKISDVQRSSKGIVNSLVVNNKNISIKVFIDTYLIEELPLVETLLQKGLLIPKRRRQRASSYLTSLLSEIFP